MCVYISDIYCIFTYKMNTFLISKITGSFRLFTSYSFSAYERMYFRALILRQMVTTSVIIVLVSKLTISRKTCVYVCLLEKSLGDEKMQGRQCWAIFLQ